jgi:hypothetical protein
VALGHLPGKVVRNSGGHCVGMGVDTADRTFSRAAQRCRYSIACR